MNKKYEIIEGRVYINGTHCAIDELTENDVKAIMSIVGGSVETVKDHTIYFIDFNNHFGYSALVFRNGRHVNYANEYELHHHYFVNENGRDALHGKFIENLNNKLFTDSELLQPVKNYNEYAVKNYFIRNYYIMQFDHISAFYIGRDQENELKKRVSKYPLYNDISFCYMRECDRDKITRQRELFDYVNFSWQAIKNSSDVFRKAIAYELSNHEACITMDPSEALGALGYTWRGLTYEQRKIVKQELDKQINYYCNGSNDTEVI